MINGPLSPLQSQMLLMCSESCNKRWQHAHRPYIGFMYIWSRAVILSNGTGGSGLYSITNLPTSAMLKWLRRYLAYWVSYSPLPGSTKLNLKLLYTVVSVLAKVRKRGAPPICVEPKPTPLIKKFLFHFHSVQMPVQN